MIRQVIKVEDKWKVIVYYNINYNLFNYVLDDVSLIIDDKYLIKRVYNTMKSRRAKGVTISNPNYPISVVLFNTHKNKSDYINTIVHEAEHVKQAMLKYYDVDDEGEAPAYTIGFLVMKMLQVAKKIVM